MQGNFKVPSLKGLNSNNPKLVVLSAANYVNSLNKANLRISRIKYHAYVHDGGVKSSPRISVSSTNNTPLEKTTITLDKPNSVSEMRTTACFLYCIGEIGKANKKALDILFTTRRGGGGYDDAISTKHHKDGKLQNKFSSILESMKSEINNILEEKNLKIPSDVSDIGRDLIKSSRGDGNVSLITLKKIRKDYEISFYKIHLEYRKLLENEMIDKSILPTELEFPTFNFDELQIELDEKVRHIEKMHSNEMKIIENKVKNLSENNQDLIKKIDWLNSRSLWKRLINSQKKDN